MKKQISVIITTYNWPQALRAVLMGLMYQSTHDFEVIIADDGSKDETRQFIQEMAHKMPVPVHHVFQPDQGFRASAIRNKAILKAEADYILFLDGDCIPPRDFIAEHLALKESGYFVVGNRILLSQEFTIRVLSEDLRISQWPWWSWIFARLRGNCNRFLPFFKLPLNAGFRKKNPQNFKGAKGCHLGVWREDLVEVNGWEEKYEGWGYEDSDLVIRLIQSGIKRKDARFRIPVIHLWHPFNTRENAEKNLARLKMQQLQQVFVAEQGLDQYQYMHLENTI